MEETRRPFMTTKKVAELLGVKPCSVRAFIDRGIIPPPIDQRSSKHLFRRSLVEKYISQKEAQAIKTWRNSRGWRAQR